jgi:hypothetical protein
LPLIYALDRKVAGISNAKIDQWISILSKLVYSLTILTCIPKPTCSNLGEDVGCFYQGFLCCLQFPTDKFWNRSADLQLGHSGFLPDPSQIIIILQKNSFSI